MRAMIATAALAALAGAAQAQEPATARQTVYLATPGDMEKLKASNPGHYRKLVSILGPMDQEGDWRVTEAVFGGRHLPVGGFLLTTFPPKRDFTVSLDSTIYHGRVTLDLKYRPMTLEYRRP